MTLIEKGGFNMGYIVDREVAYLIGKSAVDSWGIGVAEETRTPIKCLIKASEESTGLATIGGKQVIPTYVLYVNGKTPVRVGDLLEVDGDIKEVVSKREAKDITRKVIYTKLTV